MIQDKYIRQLKDDCEKLRYRHDNVWHDFVTVSAISIANNLSVSHFRKEREEEYESIMAQYSDEDKAVLADMLTVTMTALMENPFQDFLGEAYMQLRKGNSALGQVFTPYHISKLMSEVTLGKDHMIEMLNDHDYVSVSDPCSGAGVMGIAAADSLHEVFETLEDPDDYRNHLIFCGQDLDRTCVLMSYIQHSVIGTAAAFKVGNSLTEPMFSGDNIDESYWFTPNFCKVAFDKGFLGHAKETEKVMEKVG